MTRHVSFGAIAAAAVAAGAIVSMASNVAMAKPEVVAIDLGYAPGTVVIINAERKIYYVTGAGKAIRYGVAVGKAAELWTGRTFVSDKKIDPKWIPIDGSEPVEGGDSANPLGKRAMYLDWSLLRIHGTPSRGSIGSAVSNGCVRMLNEDVLDLFERVHIGAPVFAIASRADAGTFKTAKVAELVYANPTARLDAKADELDAAAERRLRLQAAQQVSLPERFVTPKRTSFPPVQFSAPSRPFAPQYRSGLGRSGWSMENSR